MSVQSTPITPRRWAPRATDPQPEATAITSFLRVAACSLVIGLRQEYLSACVDCKRTGEHEVDWCATERGKSWWKSQQQLCSRESPKRRTRKILVDSGKYWWKMWRIPDHHTKNFKTSTILLKEQAIIARSQFEKVITSRTKIENTKILVLKMTRKTGQW